MPSCPFCRRGCRFCRGGWLEPESVSTIIRDDFGRVLVLRRSATDPWKPGHWDLPGGRIDPGESARVAARREAWEEAHVSVTGLGKPVAFRRGGLHAYYVARGWRVDRGGVRLSHEHDRYGWLVPASPGKIGPFVPGLLDVLTQA